MTTQERARWDELHDLILLAPLVAPERVATSDREDLVTLVGAMRGHIDGLHSQCVRIIQARRDGVLTARDTT